jgi:3D-(3,5/4)-trihydroxycyclohexane-1,2-dione acylhydrolase (decyclizing)
VGVFHIYGDETTHGEGYNMQQIPKREQGLFGQLTALMGESYVLHTPEALRDALRRGVLRVDHPYKPGPFYLLLPLNIQPQLVTVNLNALPGRGGSAQGRRAGECTSRGRGRCDPPPPAHRYQGRRRHPRPR